ncbi:hypothetical protein [uncultured Roseobacter sp.]|uniref:hypothetical protein n=1 Tax=uncultured Roseobacter sp. TaxID=114847 RepID=UPI002630DE27|nr:hypothetical protein [uncultured Roseobacter sp.]
MGSTSPTLVKHRKVFYIPGYDPFPPRRYRELFRKESAAQAAISGYQIEMLGALEGAAFGWRVQAEIDGQKTESEFEVLVWSDIVQNSFHASILLTYAALIRTAWIYISTGALWRLMRLRKGPVIAALFPVVALLLQAAIAWAIGFLGWLVVDAFLSTIWNNGLAVGLVATGGAFLLAWQTLRLFKKHDGRIFAHYLMHDFAHTASQYGAYPTALTTRLKRFEGAIAGALVSDVDEVLVVGHSSGAHLAVTVLAALIREGHIPADGPKLAFLSLGQVVPMVSFLPRAHALRRDLKYLSTSDLTWVDVTAPGDGCSFSLCDPVGVSGQGTPQKKWPLVFSAVFTKSLSPERWRALRWRFFKLHFQYLCAFDRPRDYDYFQITAGPRALADRYEGRPASRSRIDHTVSRYTSTEP